VGEKQLQAGARVSGAQIASGVKVVYNDALAV
jgi:hypothetical protein